MRVSAARRIGAAGAEARVRPLDPAIVVEVVRDRLDVAVGEAVEVLSGLAVVVAALDDMIQVGNHAGGDEGVADVVEIETPLVAHALGKHLEEFLRRMIAPHGSVERRALGVARAGASDVGMREHALVSVEPSIGSPHEAVQRFVRILPAPAVEHRLRRAVRDVVTIAIRNEQEVGRAAHPHAAVPDGDAAREIELIVEHRRAVMAAVAVGIFHHQDPVAAVRGPGGVGVVLHHPEAAALIDRERDRLVHRRLAREGHGAKAGRERHGACGFLGGEPLAGGDGELPCLRREADGRRVVREQSEEQRGEDAERARSDQGEAGHWGEVSVGEGRGTGPGSDVGTFASPLVLRQPRRRDHGCARPSARCTPCARAAPVATAAATRGVRRTAIGQRGSVPA